MLFSLRLLESALHHLLKLTAEIKIITEIKIMAPSITDIFNDNIKYDQICSLIKFTIAF